MMNRRFLISILRYLAWLSSLVLLLGCRQQPGAVAKDNSSPVAEPAQPGGPRADLDDAALARWHAGKVEFLRIYTAEMGLGPHFNVASCAGCHDHPTTGGHGDMAHAARLTFVNGDVDGLPQKAIPGFTPLVPAPGIPVSMHRPPPLYGLGLLEAIPDTWLASHCGDKAEDGIHGVANFNQGMHRVSRFGYKAHAVTLVDFIANAMSLEMGVTNPRERDLSKVHDADAVADPEAPTPVVDAIADYVRGLAAPQRLQADAAGEALFRKVGCATCHRPETAPGVAAFSDLCVHDMGPAFDNGIRDFLAGPRQWRTSPLWGLRFRQAYFHDDRATELDQAIRLHGGEADKVRERYQALPADQQAVLQAWLRTL